MLSRRTCHLFADVGFRFFADYGVCVVDDFGHGALDHAVSDVRHGLGPLQ